jgi:hypothetical protein
MHPGSLLPVCPTRHRIPFRSVRTVQAERAFATLTRSRNLLSTKTPAQASSPRHYRHVRVSRTTTLRASTKIPLLMKN